MAGSSTARPDQPVFYYDLGSPHCYLVAETIMSALPVVPEWEPVLGTQIDAESFDRDHGQDIEPVNHGQHGEHVEYREHVERLVTELGLQPLRWPRSWPPDTGRALLAATYAKRIGRTVAFSLAAFRQAFAGGRDLGDEETILIAGAACEMHPTALLKGIELASTRAALSEAASRARQAGVSTLPALQIGDSVFAGLSAIQEATIVLNA
jgi:2-hydroxychromene-2-carboxylate isomerase